MKLDHNGSTQTYIGTEGTVCRYRYQLAIAPQTFVGMDVLIDMKDPELKMVAVRPGETSEGIVTGGCAKYFLRSLNADGTKAPAGTTPDAFEAIIDNGSVVSYFGPRIGRFLVALGILDVS